MSKTEWKRVSLLLRPEEWEALQAIARQQGRPLSVAIRRVLRESIAKQKRSDAAAAVARQKADAVRQKADAERLAAIQQEVERIIRDALSEHQAWLNAAREIEALNEDQA